MASKFDFAKALAQITDCPVDPSRPAGNNNRWTYERIAKEVGTSTSTINRLVNDPEKRPDFDQGMAIIELHQKVLEAIKNVGT